MNIEGEYFPHMFHNKWDIFPRQAFYENDSATGIIINNYYDSIA
jgi:hypothetical protein